MRLKKYRLIIRLRFLLKMQFTNRRSVMANIDGLLKDESGLLIVFHDLSTFGFLSVVYINAGMLQV